MKVNGLILAGGSGLRLDPIATPKPLVRIGTKPLIVWTIDYLQRLGLEDIWLVVGQHGDAIQKELIGNRHVTSRLHFLRMPHDSRSMFQTLAYAVSKVPGPLLITPCDLIFERYPVQTQDLTALRDDECQLFAMPVTKEWHFGPQLLLEVEHSSGTDAIVKDLGVDHERGNFQATEIFLAGETGKSNFAVAPELTVNGEAFSPFLKDLFKNRKAQVKLADATNWCDVNTAIDKIRAEFIIKPKTGTQPVVRRADSRETIPPSRQTFTFEFAKKKTTEVIVEPNILEHLWDYNLIPEASAGSNHYLVTDSRLYDIAGKKIEEGFHSRGYSLRSVIAPDGEEIKTIDEYWRIMLDILAQGVDRNSIIMNLGGGAINNVAGFVASTLFRGVSLYHIPTTLLAQLDSTVDIKHAINTPYGKNLVGSFYAADKVIIDSSILTLLPEEHIVNGLSESIKHALVQDASFLDYYNQYQGAISAPDFLEKVIHWTIELKVKCMDGRPDGGHADGIKDYGHSLGHALEQYTGYEIHHGQAISVGMCLSAEIARILNVTGDREVDMHYRIFEKFGLATSITPDVNLDAFEMVLKRDKTYMQGNAYMGLITELGHLWNNHGNYVIPVDMHLVRKALEINQKKFSPQQKIKKMTYVRKG